MYDVIAILLGQSAHYTSRTRHVLDALLLLINWRFDKKYIYHH
jgi:hypothetical protein